MTTNINEQQWEEFKNDITSIYNELKNNTNGNVADYIPQLANVNPDLFSISVTTIDNKTFSIGDHNKSFCIQSCSKPLNYALALDENGSEYVDKHIGIEPSGAKFNAFAFDDQNKPFNALINAGAIVSTSLIKKKDTQDQRFEYIISKWKEICGEDNVGFNNGVYLSEKRTANRNYALSHLMMENNIFPENTNIENTLELYFQCCSITMNSDSLSKFAAMLANGGVTVDTNKKVLSSSIVKSILCVMYSSGMYDYSGRWSYHVGLPAKSGVSGSIFVVIPNFCGICIYSPRLDEIGNSVRGLEFFHKLISNYRFHIFDTLVSGLEKKKNLNNSSGEKLSKLCKACCDNNINEVNKIIESGDFDINEGDYDGRRALHIATDECNYKCIELLLQNGADCNVTDRWQMSPYKKSLEYKDKTITSIFDKFKNCEIDYKNNNLSSESL